MYRHQFETSQKLTKKQIELLNTFVETTLYNNTKDEDIPEEQTVLESNIDLGKKYLIYV